jgi:hypothetical protein
MTVHAKSGHGYMDTGVHSRRDPKASTCFLSETVCAYIMTTFEFFLLILVFGKGFFVCSIFYPKQAEVR